MKTNEQLKDISEIRKLMERSAKFLSLSGLSGIAVGVVGLLAAATVHFYLKQQNIDSLTPITYALPADLIQNIILLGCITLIAALGLAVLFSRLMSKKKGLPLWPPSTKYLLLHFFMPLLTGGFFCFILLYYEVLFLLPATMLIFYGLGLFSASKFTVVEVRNLGLAEIFLGLAAAVWVSYGLAFWAVGFGVLHILNGILIYLRHEG